MLIKFYCFLHPVLKEDAEKLHGQLQHEPGLELHPSEGGKVFLLAIKSIKRIFRIYSALDQKRKKKNKKPNFIHACKLVTPLSSPEKFYLL